MKRTHRRSLLSEFDPYELGTHKRTTGTKSKHITYGCDECGLYKSCRSPKMVGYGKCKKGIMIIAEAPGREEDIQNRPLVGESGRFLRDALSGMGWNMDEDFYRTNVLQCRPPNNELGTGRVRKIRLESCKNRWEQEIAEYQPKMVIILGEPAFESITGKTGIRRYRGFMIPSEKFNTLLCPTYHPQYVIRQSRETGTDEILDIWTRDIFSFLTDGLDKSHRLHEYLDWRETVDTFNVTKIDQFRSTLEYLMQEDILSVDFETNALKIYLSDDPQILCVSFTSKDLASFCIPVSKGNYWNKKELEEVRKGIADILVSDRIGKVVQNAQFEAMWAEIFGVELRNVIADTMIDAHLLYARSSKSESQVRRKEGVTSLDFQVYTTYGCEYKDMVNHSRLEEEDDEILFKYNNLDSKFTMRLYLEREDKMKEMMFARTLFVEGQMVFHKWETNGIRIDLEELNKQDLRIVKELEIIDEKIRNYPEINTFRDTYGRDPVIGENASTKDVQTLLFEVMNIPPVRFTDKGNKALDEDVLVSYAEKYPICKDFIELRKLNTHRKKYLTGVRACLTDDYAHPSANLNTVSTMRSSYENPNFQNFPKRDETFKEVRKIIVPDEGHIIGEADYSGIEVRVAAMMSKDPVLVKYLNEDYDMHMEWARRIFKSKDVDDKLRYHAKNKFVFPEFYGSYYGSIHKDLQNLPEFTSLFMKRGQYDYYGAENHLKECEKQFWQTFKVFKVWKEELFKFYDVHGYVQNLFGFRRYGPLGRNMIINAPIQGQAFHFLLYAIKEIDKSIEWGKLNSRMLFEVHDAIVFSIDPEEKEFVQEFVTDKMCNLPFDFINVPISVKWEFSSLKSPSWYDTV